MKKVYWAIGAVAGILLTYFIFIPAFAGRIFINPILSIGPLELRWYGLIMAGAILAGFLVARKNSWKFGISQPDVDDFSFWAVIAGIVGARIYYVLFNYPYFSQNLSEIYKIWHGGLSVYGAILAGLIFGYFYTRKKAYNFFQLFDLVALGLPLGQAIGRFGNFINQEAFGTPTDLPWKMYIQPQFRPQQFAGSSFFHPVFLYEAILSIAIFFFLQKFIGRVKSGIIGWTYLLLYSLGRFFIEIIRTDSFFLAGFRVDQITAFLLFVFAGFFIFLEQKEPTLDS